MSTPLPTLHTIGKLNPLPDLSICVTLTQKG